MGQRVVTVEIWGKIVGGERMSPLGTVGYTPDNGEGLTVQEFTESVERFVEKVNEVIGGA